MDQKNKELLEKWHSVVFEKNMESLKELLSDKITFYSPVVFKPKNTRVEAMFVLSNVIEVFKDFKYHREFIDGKNWALEFSANVGDKSVKGIDLIEFDDNGQIVNFEVLIRPLSGLIALGEDMNKRFAAAGIMTKPLVR
ncbi:MAG TPA: nuclear transport factor 2 family protein [Spirochaetota bacterium]|nr:nuclear transport factor 2 family protein [Spirochaetota bacterium]